MSEPSVARKLAAILSADVEGYSRLMQDDDVETVRTLTAYRTRMAEKDPAVVESMVRVWGQLGLQ